MDDRQRIERIKIRLGLLLEKETPTQEDAKIALQDLVELLGIALNVAIDIRDDIKRIKENTTQIM